MHTKQPPRATDWDSRQVLLGLLSSTRQLEQNLAHRFYHIPQKLLACPPQQVAYVALYRSKRLFGETMAGVWEYGRVRSFALVARGEITELTTRGNAREPYWRFEVEPWVRLKRPIRAMGLAPGVGTMTTRYLLEHSRCIPELYIRTQDQLRVYTTLRAACARTKRNGGSERLAARNGAAVLVAGNTIGAYTRDGEYSQWDLREFLYRPNSFLEQMQALLEPELSAQGMCDRYSRGV